MPMVSSIFSPVCSCFLFFSLHFMYNPDSLDKPDNPVMNIAHVRIIVYDNPSVDQVCRSTLRYCFGGSVRPGQSPIPPAEGGVRGIGEHKLIPEASDCLLKATDSGLFLSLSLSLSFFLSFSLPFPYVYVYICI